MSEGIFLFNRNQDLIASIDPDMLTENYNVQELNWQITGTAQVIYNEKIESAIYFGVKDKDNFLMYKIRKFIKEDGLITIEGIHVFFDDLKGQVIRDIRPQNTTAALVLNRVLENTGWTVFGAGPDTLASTNFYHVSAISAFWDAVKIWNFEFIPVVKFSDGKIISKELHIYTQISKDYGKWYEYGDKLLDIVSESSTDELFTAFIGRGKGLAIEDEDGNATGGFGRKIKFDDISYTNTIDGVTVNKPIGIDYIEIPGATVAYGYPDGSPRIGVIDFENIEDKIELANATFEYALNNCRPKLQLKASAIEGETVELGETVAIIRSDMNIRYKVRVFKIKKDFLQDRIVSYEFGDKIVSSVADRLKYEETERKKIVTQYESYIEYLRAAITSSYFNEDGYNYDLRVGNEYGLPAGYYSFDKPIDQDPKKVIYIGAGKMLISNSKNPDGSWKWQTASTGDGVVAESIVGTLGEFAKINANQIVVGAGFSQSQIGQAISSVSNKVTIDSNGIMVYNDESFNYTIDLNGIKSDAETAKTNAQNAINAVDNAVMQNTLYNGVRINTSSGLTVSRSDGLVTVTVNATDGLRIDNRSNTSSAWNRVFYINTSGQAQFTGDLTILNSRGNVAGTIYASSVTDLAVQATSRLGLVDGFGYSYLRFYRGAYTNGSPTEALFDVSGVGFRIYGASYPNDYFAITPKQNIRGYSSNGMFVGILRADGAASGRGAGFQFDFDGVHYTDRYGTNYLMDTLISDIKTTKTQVGNNAYNLTYVLDQLQSQGIYINRSGLR